MDADFQVTIERFESVAWVRLRVAGELDLATAPQLEAAIGSCAAPPASRTPVVLDLTAVTFIDSTGLGVVLRANDSLGGRLSIAPSRACERLFEIAGVRDRLPLVRRDGVAKLNAESPADLQVCRARQHHERAPRARPNGNRPAP